MTDPHHADGAMQGRESAGQGGHAGAGQAQAGHRNGIGKNRIGQRLAPVGHLTFIFAFAQLCRIEPNSRARARTTAVDTIRLSFFIWSGYGVEFPDGRLLCQALQQALQPDVRRTTCGFGGSSARWRQRCPIRTRPSAQSAAVRRHRSPEPSLPPLKGRHRHRS